MKTCSKCKTSKGLTDFSPDKRASDGRASMCRVCNASYRTKNVGKNAHLKDIPNEPMGMRYCTNCKTIKVLDDFDTETHTKNGDTITHYRRQCKKCRILESREYNKAHPEVRKQANDRLLQHDPDYYINYRSRNRDELLRKAKARYRADPAKANLQVANARRKRPDHYRMLSNTKEERRRTKKKNLPAQYTYVDWLNCLTYFNNVCAVCGCQEDRVNGVVLAMDHWIPVNNPNSPGHIPTNVVPLCHATKHFKKSKEDRQRCCNNSKGAKNPVEWLKDQFPQEADDILARINTYFEALV